MEKRVVFERRGNRHEARGARRASSQPPRADDTLLAASAAATAAATVLDAIDTAILVFDMHGACVYASSRAAALLGVNDTRVLLGGRGPSEIADDIAIAIEKGEVTTRPQLAIARSDGAPASWVSLTVRPSAGGAVATLVDVSARQAEDEQSAFRKILLQSQSDASLDAILVVSPSSEFISYNKRFIEMWGVPDHIVASGSDKDALDMVLTKVTDPAGFFSRVQHLYDNPNEESRDQIALLDGRTVDRYSAPVRDAAGKHYGRVWFFRDVTERVRVEAEREELLSHALTARAVAEEASHAKDQFLAVVSHELRTPLTAVLGWARILKRPGRTDAERDRALSIIERNALLQAKLIEDLLDVSRVVMGKIRLNVGPVELGSIVSCAVDSIQPAASARGITVSVEVDAPSTLTTGDEERLQQVAFNLVTNAIKFTPEGGHVTVRLKRTSSVTELIVEDNGIGIDPAFLPHVFERFRQADGSPTTRNHGGLGLGLSIVRHIVELHGGSVVAESEGKGKGSRFVVRLPVRALTSERRAARHGPRVGPSSAPPGAMPDLDGIRVLFVDDEADARDLLADLLGGCGAIVTGASRVDEALSTVASNAFDVVVSDISMPEKDGYALIKELRQLELELGRSPTPTIALTAMASDAARESAYEAGFDAHVTKPAEPFAFAHAVAELVGRGARVEGAAG
jgi:signal transduction histidine kinase/ActR/RegA family two-component response regulator